MSSKNQTIVTNSAERKPGLASGEVDMSRGVQTFSMEDTAQGRNPLTAEMNIDVVGKVSSDALEQERFMAEMLEIQLAEASSEEENQYAEITVNSSYRMLRRGDAGMFPRSHVAILAQAKEMRLKQTKVVAADGSMAYEERLISRQTYPFTVIHDPSGRKGSDWLRAMLKNPH